LAQAVANWENSHIHSTGHRATPQPIWHRTKDIQDPIECDTQLLFEAGEFQKVNRPPEPPGGESREIEAKNSGDTGAPTDRS
jgi:hypothetical protein